MKKNIKNICIFSFILLLFDQIIKIFLSNVMELNESFVLIKKFFSITLVHNKGAAFSILSGNRFLLIGIGIIAVVGIIYYLKKSDYLSKLDIFIYSFLIGGVLGNLIDRIVHGYVIDYLSFNFGTYYFPIFNFADICIVISVIFMIFNIIREDLWK